MQFVEPSEPRRTERKSSISQFSGLLSVRRGDEWVPIVFDSLDGIDCKKIKTHKSALALEPFIGYAFPVGECSYSESTYLLSDQKGTELKKLPEWFGDGFYEEHFDRKVFVNGDNGALGVKNDTTLRVGLDYVVAKKYMKPIK